MHFTALLLPARSGLLALVCLMFQETTGKPMGSVASSISNNISSRIDNNNNDIGMSHVLGISSGINGNIVGGGSRSNDNDNDIGSSRNFSIPLVPPPNRQRATFEDQTISLSKPDGWTFSIKSGGPDPKSCGTRQVAEMNTADVLVGECLRQEPAMYVTQMYASAAGEPDKLFSAVATSGSGFAFVSADKNFGVPIGAFASFINRLGPQILEIAMTRDFIRRPRLLYGDLYDGSQQPLGRWILGSLSNVKAAEQAQQLVPLLNPQPRRADGQPQSYLARNVGREADFVNGYRGTHRRKVAFVTNPSNLTATSSDAGRNQVVAVGPLSKPVNVQVVEWRPNWSQIRTWALMTWNQWAISMVSDEERRNGRLLS